jgi:hypothetical protein
LGDIRGNLYAKKTMPTIRISVSIKRKQWFIYPPRIVLNEFKKIHKHGVCIYNAIGGKEDDKAIKAIHDITELILSKKA